MEAKVEEVLPGGEDRPWFRQRLRALLGLEAAKAEREENFTAWLRFLEEIAAQGPTVLILEDLHWADEALLDFLEFFALHVTHVPLMIVATARSELFERHPSFGGAVRINRIALEPLSQDETEELIGSVLDDLAADLRASIAEQAQGNPFYAEESARLVRDRAEGDPRTSLLAGSVQAVVAARLDALAPELKAVLSDAAVVGDVFWDGLLAAMSERGPDEVARALDELTVKQLVYRVRSSSMAGEREYAFSHALAREVGYVQLPRLARAKKHTAVAHWIEEKAGNRRRGTRGDPGAPLRSGRRSRPCGRGNGARRLPPRIHDRLPDLGRQTRPRGRCWSGRTLLLPCHRSRRSKRGGTTGTHVRLGQDTFPDEAASGVCGRLGEGDRGPTSGRRASQGGSRDV